MPERPRRQRRTREVSGAATGTVVEQHGIRATVLLHDSGERVRCRPPRDRTITAVGDRVEVLDGRHGPRVEAVAERDRSLWRPREQGRQLMATHVDRVLVVSAVEPRPKPGFIDRALLATQASGIPAILVLNKVDLPGADGARSQLDRYAALGFGRVDTSALRGDGLEELRSLTGEGLTVVIGQSGVGKSTLLNALIPGVQLATQALSDASGKGRHTTSVTTCHPVGAPWPAGGLLVDTPGVRTFGLYGLELVDVSAGFPEMAPYLRACRFNDCLHEAEPECAVRDAVDAGEVGEDRYVSYLHLVASLRAGEG